MKHVISMFAALVLALGCATAFAAEPKHDEKEAKISAVIERVNINKADAKTIAKTLHRVGLKRAEAIVAWRESNGNFTSIEQLLQIKGIGKSILENNRDRILL